MQSFKAKVMTFIIYCTSYKLQIKNELFLKPKAISVEQYYDS